MKKLNWIFIICLLFGCGPSAPAPDLFGLPVPYHVGKKPATVVARDMNSDGYADVLVPNSASNTLSYLEGVGDGTFKAASLPIWARCVMETKLARP